MLSLVVPPFPPLALELEGRGGGGLLCFLALRSHLCSFALLLPWSTPLPAPRTVRVLMDLCAPAGSLHALQLPARSLGGPGCGLRTATGAVGIAHALGVTTCGLVGSACVLPAAAGLIVVVLVHVGTVPRPVSPLLSSDRSWSRERSWRSRWRH